MKTDPKLAQVAGELGEAAAMILTTVFAETDGCGFLLALFNNDQEIAYVTNGRRGPLLTVLDDVRGNVDATGEDEPDEHEPDPSNEARA